MPEWDLKKRTKDFAHHCVKLCLVIREDCLGIHIKKQLIRSCTSVAANYRSACMAQSKASFVSKLSIVIEEVDECCFWLEFIVDEAIIKGNKITPLLKEAKELTAIFVVSRKTAKPREDN